MARQSFSARCSSRGLWFPVALTVLLLLTIPGIVLLALTLLGMENSVNAWLQDTFSISYHIPLPWWAALLLLLTPFLILLLYFLKMKRRPLQVPSTFLWRKSIEDLQVNSLFQWLRDNMLLLLQLLIVLLLIYAAMAFQVHGATITGKHYILLIDSSASMSVTDGLPSRLDAARQEALNEIDRHADGDSGMVIEFNSRASILQPYTSDRALLRGAVQRIRQTYRPTHIDEALALADSLANPLRSTEDESVRPANEDPTKARTYVAREGVAAEVHLFSDGCFSGGQRFTAGNLDVRYHRIGLPGADKVDNVGIVAMGVTRNLAETEDLAATAKKAREEAPRIKAEIAQLEKDPDALSPEKKARLAELGKLAEKYQAALKEQESAGKLLVFVRVLNFRRDSVTTRIQLQWRVWGKDDFNLKDEEITLKGRTITAGDPDKNEPPADRPGEASATFELPDVENNTSLLLHARLIDHRDQFPLDDEAWLVVGVVRKARVLIVTPGNDVLRNFFDLEATARVADVRYLKPADLKDDSQYGQPARDGAFDLVIFDRCAPETEEGLPLGNTFFIDAVPPPWLRSEMPALQHLQIQNSASTHPLMRDLTALDEIAISQAFRFELDPEKNKGVPPRTPRLLETGRNTAVLFTLARQRFTDLVLAFPLFPLVNARGEWASTWPLKLSFPVFLRNVLYELGNVNDAAAEENLPPGELKVIRPDTAVHEIEIFAPGARTAELLSRGKQADFVYNNTEQLGFYRVRWADGERAFAVNLLDADESNIQPRDSVRLGSQQVAADTTGGAPRDTWKWWALGALVFLVVEWAFYHRRWFA
jgi:hypothetical protein